MIKLTKQEFIWLKSALAEKNQYRRELEYLSSMNDKDGTWICATNGYAIHAVHTIQPVDEINYTLGELYGEGYSILPTKSNDAHQVKMENIMNESLNSLQIPSYISEMEIVKISAKACLQYCVVINFGVRTKFVGLFRRNSGMVPNLGKMALLDPGIFFNAMSVHETDLTVYQPSKFEENGYAKRPFGVLSKPKNSMYFNKYLSIIMPMYERGDKEISMTAMPEQLEQSSFS